MVASKKQRRKRERFGRIATGWLRSRNEVHPGELADLLREVYQMGRREAASGYEAAEAIARTVTVRLTSYAQKRGAAAVALELQKARLAAGQDSAEAGR